MISVKGLEKHFGDLKVLRGVTFSPLMPLLAVALVYLVLVVFFTKLVSILERRLRQSDIR